MKHKCIIKVKLIGGSGYIEDIDLTPTEYILFKNRENINACWEMLCQSIEDRLGMRIIGNFSLVSYIEEGVEKPLH